jgi:hypothetical protein
VALKQAVGTDLIHEREQRLLRRALARWRRNPNLELLGNLEVPRLPIVSFRIRHWRHRDAPPDPVLSLPDLLDGRSWPGPVSGGDDLAGHLEQARELLEAAPVAPAAGPSWLPPELERLRDFHLPAT